MKDRHDELKTALRLLNESQSGFAATLVSPATGKRISPTYLNLVSKGKEESEWVEAKIDAKIREAKETFPEAWRRMEEKAINS